MTAPQTFSPHIPSELRTPRLLLRAPRPEDAAALHGAVHASLPELQKWMVWAQDPADLAGTAENLRGSAERYAAREELRLLVWNTAGTQLIGSSGFHALDWRVPKGEIGYWISSAHTGQGYAQEVAGALTTFGLKTLGLRRIEIRCDSANERSARIPRTLEYTLDATFRNNAVAADEPGRLRDTLIFSVVR